MSVIVDVDCEGCEELSYRYQICEEDNPEDGYFVYVSAGPLTGKYWARRIETLREAMCELLGAMDHYEWDVSVPLESVPRGTYARTLKRLQQLREEATDEHA